MPWFKVDDTFPHHAKVLAAGNAAVGLWVRAGAWSMQQLTDGFVPAHVAGSLGKPAEARRLIEVGLWVRVEGGFQFHQWRDVQRTREQVQADRDAATERQRRARDAAKSRRDAPDSSRRDGFVSHGSPDQTRPEVPTEPENTSAADATDPTPGLSLVATDDRPDVDRLCTHLADRIAANGSPRPSIGKGWRDAARLLLDRDGRTEADVHRAIDWCQDHEFWRSNVLSMPKLREQYDQLRLQAGRRPGAGGSRQADTDGIFERAAQRAAQQEGNRS